MNSTDRELKELIDRHLKWPSDLSFTAARGRVREQLFATPAYRQTARIADAPSSIPMWRMAAAAAVVVIVVIGTIFWPRGVQAYSAGDDGLQVTLADDSSVEMRAHAQMTVGRASDGLQIDLQTGDIIVTAAQQRDGHLYVRTKDMTVVVDGTVFLVNASQEGSRVGVIEGEVRVREGGKETRLRPGEQVATNSAIVARPLTEDINWSKNATAHRAVLDSRVISQAVTLAPIAPPQQAAAASSQAAKTEFEEASIRECDSPTPPPGTRGSGPGRFQLTPGRTSAQCLTLATLIRTAYGGGLQDGALMPPPGVPIPVAARGGRGPDPRSFAGASAMSFSAAYFLGVEDGARVRGGPDWVRSTLYTIEAVAAGAADAQAMRGPMLRALLERRFGLKVHVETEQFPVPQLTVAPGGHKMKPATCTISGPSPAPAPGDTAARDAAARRNLDVVRQNLDAARRGAPISGFCGGATAMNGPNQVMVINGFRAPEIDVILSRLLGAPLINRTGIPDTASFSFVLEFVPDDSLDLDQVARGDRQIASDPSTVPRAPGIVTALEEQLGLRLERVRMPREFIVIDAVERPTPN
jgi:uncharacterized protein (TIGR03435 family)